MAKKKTYEEWLAEVEEDGTKLRYVPEDMRTKEMCLTAVAAWQSEPPLDTLKYVPKEHITKELLHAAINRYGTPLEFFPEEMIEESDVITAIETTSDTYEPIIDIPRKFLTKKVCLLALETFDFDEEDILDDFLSDIPDEVWYDKDFMSAVFGKEYGFEFKHIAHLLEKEDFYRYFWPIFRDVNYDAQYVDAAKEDYLNLFPERLQEQVKKAIE